MFSPVEGTADSIQSLSGSLNHARGSARDPTVQRLAYQTGESPPLVMPIVALLVYSAIRVEP